MEEAISEVFEPRRFRVSKIIAPVATGLGGAACGYFMQQNREALNQLKPVMHPFYSSPELTFITAADLATLFVRDVHEKVWHGRPTSFESLWSDAKYVGLMNAGIAAGYVGGMVKDVLEKYNPF